MTAHEDARPRRRAGTAGRPVASLTVVWNVAALWMAFPVTRATTFTSAGSHPEWMMPISSKSLASLAGFKRPR